MRIGLQNFTIESLKFILNMPFLACQKLLVDENCT